MLIYFISLNERSFIFDYFGIIENGSKGFDEFLVQVSGRKILSIFFVGDYNEKPFYFLMDRIVVGSCL